MEWMCEGKIEFGSTCTQRILIDAVNLIFISTYLLLLFVATLRNGHTQGGSTQNWLFSIVSLLSVVVGVAYVGLFSWTVFGRNQASTTWASSSSSSSIYLVIRALVWILIAVSLNLRPTRCIRILISAWWTCFSLSISALNLKILVQDHGLPILEIASWAVNLVLLLCGIQLICHLFQPRASSNGRSQPLLMKTEHKETKRTGASSSSFTSRLTFSWLNPLISLGNFKPLNLNDIPELDSKDDAALAYDTFFKEFEYQRNHTTKATNLALFALGRCYKKEMLQVGLYALLKTFSVVVSPSLLYGFVQYSNRKDRDVNEGLLLIAYLVAAKVVESLSQRHWFFDSRRFGMRMRSALIAAVFKKLLKLSSPGRRKHSTGEIVNYIAVDAYRLGEFPWWFHMAWSLPLQMVLSMAVLFSVAGTGAVFSLVPLLICGMLNIPIAKKIHKSQYHFMVAQDERLGATSEILNSMKIIKLQSWEEHFRGVIESFRDAEFKWLKNTQIIKSCGTGLFWMSPTVVSALVFVGCAVIGSAPLNAATIFTVVAILRVIGEPVRMLPEVLSVLIQVKVSLDRLDVFLLENEIAEDDRNKNKLQRQNTCIRIQNGVFSWDSDGMNLTLKGINLEITIGQKVAVCGPVGSGKSSILSSILGEIPRISGLVDANGSIAYVSQTAWIQCGTIRDNILYGKPMDRRRYEMAIKACALDKDINDFDHGDLTEIGQRGLNMSGGQKQRIQLARAVYSDADIYLLDDPFSAVDAHTASILFNDCVMTALKEKTIILVTHQIEFLPDLDRILVMKDGDVIQLGTYEELLTTGTTFEKLVDAHQSAMEIVDPSNHDIPDEGLKIIKSAKQKSDGDITAKSVSMVQLTKEEEKEMGYGGWKAYADYIRISKNHLYLAAIIFTQFSFAFLQILSSYWLAISVEIPHIGAGILVGIYTVISVLSCFFVCIRAWISAHLGLRASNAFFSCFMDSIFKAPMLFFDSTPLGRILTRASSDMSILDFDVPFAISYTLVVTIEIPLVLALIVVVTWQVIIVAVPVMIAMIYVQRYYLFSARELVRINGTTKAPLMNYAAETSLGVTTIRAFDVTEQFIENNLKLINNDATIFFHTIAAMEWVLLRLEALINVTIFTNAILIVLLPEYTVSPGFVGLSLSYAITLTNAQAFFTKWYSNLDNYIISVERINQFMHLPSEAPAVITDKRPPSSWPYEGRIDLEDIKIRYRPNAPLVLKGITCTFGAGEKIGVVGRTGSGKTTLISCLFRLVEPAGGRILIDKLDICSIGLKDLRMKLSIIPQEPTLFRGSVRKNMDPLGLHTDHEIWEALDKCQLKTTISSLPNLLDSSISEEGGNWSVGQRQLFCLGRVLLRRNKILVLDEATASVDSATDTMLQTIIREEFSSCTVVTVAHRVPTVMDSDMVMVLSYGNLVEYDKPSSLMGINSSFSKLVAEYWSNCKKKAT